MQHLVVNQNHRPAAYSAVRDIAAVAEAKLVGYQGFGFLRLIVAEQDADAVESMLLAADLPVVRQETPVHSVLLRAPGGGSA